MSGKAGTAAGPGREQDGMKLAATEKVPCPSTRLGTSSGFGACTQTAFWHHMLLTGQPCRVLACHVWQVLSLARPV